MKQSIVMKNIYKARWCANHHLKLLSKYYMLKNAILWNCHIDYNADIHPTVSFSHHGMGVVINAAAVIGEGSIIAHGVTIGNRMPNHSGSPIIGKNCYIGSGAYIGGGIVIGDNAKIAANASVVKDVPANCTAVGNPARIIDGNNKL